MKTILMAALLMATSLFSCSTFFPDAKFLPEHNGVDPRVQPLVDEYMNLSMQNHLVFDKQVTIGFKSINKGNVIGLCTYGFGWREIDLDSDFWYNNSQTERLALVFHELTHCYCGRAHDWAKGQNYSKTDEMKFEEGWFSDGCPSSLMYPVVVDANCVTLHYDDYIHEMFDRCQPY